MGIGSPSSTLLLLSGTSRDAFFFGNFVLFADVLQSQPYAPQCVPRNFPLAKLVS